MGFWLLNIGRNCLKDYSVNIQFNRWKQKTGKKTDKIFFL